MADPISSAAAALSLIRALKRALEQADANGQDVQMCISRLNRLRLLLQTFAQSASCQPGDAQKAVIETAQRSIKEILNEAKELANKITGMNTCFAACRSSGNLDRINRMNANLDRCISDLDTATSMVTMVALPAAQKLTHLPSGPIADTCHDIIRNATAFTAALHARLGVAHELRAELDQDTELLEQLCEPLGIRSESFQAIKQMALFAGWQTANSSTLPNAEIDNVVRDKRERDMHLRRLKDDPVLSSELVDILNEVAGDAAEHAVYTRVSELQNVDHHRRATLANEAADRAFDSIVSQAVVTNIVFDQIPTNVLGAPTDITHRPRRNAQGLVEKQEYTIATTKTSTYTIAGTGTGQCRVGLDVDVDSELRTDIPFNSDNEDFLVNVPVSYVLPRPGVVQPLSEGSHCLEQDIPEQARTWLEWTVTSGTVSARFKATVKIGGATRVLNGLWKGKLQGNFRQEPVQADPVGKCVIA